MECSVAGCQNKGRYVATGWCQTHYHRFWRTGSLELIEKELRTDLSYYGAHSRVKSNLGSAHKNPCIMCGGEAKEWAYDGTDESELQGSVNLNGTSYPVKYSVWPEFYMPLCIVCHRRLDAGNRAKRRTACRKGHAMTESNTMYRPDRGANARECRQCNWESYRRRHVRRGFKDPGPKDWITPGHPDKPIEGATT